jgi:cytochrome c556
MRTHARVWLASAVLLAVGVWSLSGGSGTAANGQKLGAAIQKLADTVAKPDVASARKDAEALAKTIELDSVMDLFKLRAKGGLGVGTSPGAVTPDGIEAKVMAMAKKPLTQQELDAQSAGLTKAGQVIAAVALVARHKCPVMQKTGDKDPKKWQELTQEMHTGALAVAAAAKAKQPAELKTAATKLNSTCNNCHSVFRD